MEDNSDKEIKESAYIYEFFPLSSETWIYHKQVKLAKLNI